MIKARAMTSISHAKCYLHPSHVYPSLGLVPCRLRMVLWGKLQNSHNVLPIIAYWDRQHAYYHDYMAGFTRDHVLFCLWLSMVRENGWASNIILSHGDVHGWFLRKVYTTCHGEKNTFLSALSKGLQCKSVHIRSCYAYGVYSGFNSTVCHTVKNCYFRVLIM